MLKLFSKKAVLITFTATCMAGFSGLLHAEDAMRLRAFGDAALKAHDFEHAAKYFERYKIAAKNDRRSLKDAYIRLLSAYISASKVKEAKRELEAFTRAFPFASTNLKILYQSSILMLEGKYVEAEKLLRSALKGHLRKGDLYFQMLSTLGLSLRRQKQWEKAAEVYEILEKETKGTAWEFSAFQQKLFCLIMGGELIKSKKLFSEAEKFKKSPNYKQLKLLVLLQMVMEKRFSELRETYPNVMKDITPQPNPLIYRIAQTATKHFLENNKPEDAILFLHNAYKFAPNDHERQESMLELINTYVKAKQNDKAIKIALKFIDIYFNSPKVLEVQLQCARLMAAEKQYNEAIAVFTTMLKEPRLTPAQRVVVARECAALYEHNGSIGKAARMLSMIYHIAPDTAGKMEGRFLQGELYYKNKKYPAAAAAFEEVVRHKSPWRDRAVYWALQSELQLKNYKNALLLAKELSKIDKNKEYASIGLYFTAFCQEALGSADKALENYQKFIKLHPKDKHAPAALFAAGKILFSQKKFAEVSKLFKDMPSKYPDSEFTANALYKSIFASYQIKKYDEMEKTVRLMAKKYPDSNYCIAAEFWLIDCLRNQGKYEKAEAWIEKMFKRYTKNPEVLAQLLYDHALICYRSHKSKKALKLLEKIFQDYPKNNINAKALFLAGDIASKEGNYALAEKYYIRAAKLRPKSNFEIACIGRIADCNYSIYNVTSDLLLLKKAAEAYKKLLKIDKMPLSVLNQTKYKLGRCYELLNEENDALDMYNELLYGYQIDQKANPDKKPVWVVKAGRAAILMYLQMNTPEAAREAIRVYRILKSMNLKTGEDFDGYIKNIEKKYSLEQN